MTDQEIIELVRSHLSDQRMHHTFCVARKACALCKKYREPEEPVRQAALLHDIFKETPSEKLLQMARRYGMIECNHMYFQHELLHSFVGAMYLRTEYGIPDAVAAAVRCHTAAKPAMNMAEKILFVADCISEDRSYPDRDRIDDLAFENLDLAILEILRFTLRNLIQRGAYLSDDSIAAYNYYLSLAGRRTQK